MDLKGRDPSYEPKKFFSQITTLDFTTKDKIGRWKRKNKADLVGVYQNYDQGESDFRMSH